jgi:hypothetical protein
MGSLRAEGERTWICAAEQTSAQTSNAAKLVESTSPNATLDSILEARTGEAPIR